MISFSTHGDFNKTESYFKKLLRIDVRRILERYGREGVAALKAATPVESGATAAAWDYKITGSRGNYEINWTNSNTNDGVNIAILLQYGHGTRNGGYVQGRDYINPAMRPIFEKIANEAWKAVKSA